MHSDVSGSSLCLWDHKSLCKFTFTHFPFSLCGQDAVNECQCVCVAVVLVFIIPRKNISLVRVSPNPLITVRGGIFYGVKEGSACSPGTIATFMLMLRNTFCSSRVVLSMQLWPSEKKMAADFPIIYFLCLFGFYLANLCSSMYCYSILNPSSCSSDVNCVPPRALPFSVALTWMLS